MQVAPYPGLCWPHDSQACLAHITTMILNCGRVARDMRSDHVTLPLLTIKAVPQRTALQRTRLSFVPAPSDWST